MVKKIKYTDKDVKSIASELEKELKRAQRALGKIETSVGLLQTGDKNGPYWNGSNSYKFLKSCCAQIDHDQYLLSNLNKCYDYLSGILKKN